MSPEDAVGFLTENRCGHLGINGANGYPYVVPVNYVYSQGCILIHGALTGQKVDDIKQDPRVCFEVSSDDGIVGEGRACNYSTHYRSVIAFGRARLAEGEDKLTGLRELAGGLTGLDTSSVTSASAERVALIVVAIEHLTGKRDQ
jgi:nitroimidazol reductase NimA-like FMN-containing flavoprotein (pyridoxamine 5'-phosphate oxidase superfamily)